MLTGPGVVKGSLTFDSTAATAGGSVTHSSETAAFSMTSAGDLDLTVAAGELQLAGESLRFNTGQFVIDGVAGDARISGALTVGTMTGTTASTLWQSSSNTFTVTADGDWALASQGSGGNIVLSPGAATGKFRAGPKFAVTADSGNLLAGAMSSESESLGP